MILITDPSLIIGFQHVRTPLFVLVSLLDSTISRYTIGYIQVSEYPGIQVSRYPCVQVSTVQLSSCQNADKNRNYCEETGARDASCQGVAPLMTSWWRSGGRQWLHTSLRQLLFYLFSPGCRTQIKQVVCLCCGGFLKLLCVSRLLRDMREEGWDSGAPTATITCSRTSSRRSTSRT